MHPASKLHIVGMINLIRQGLVSIEAALANEKSFMANPATGYYAPPEPEPTGVAEDYLTPEQEKKLAEMIGFEDEK